MKAAIVGCGQIADAHIQEAKKIPCVQIAAVCDSNPHMAEQAATRLQVPKFYTNLETMLREMKPDVVHVTTPPESHLAIGKKVLEFGAHAYVEKPLTATVAEAEELIDVAQRAGRLVCLGLSNAFDSSFVRLRKWVEEGRLGKVVHIDAVMGYNLNGPFGAVFMKDPSHWVHRLPGGVAHNNISHPLSFILAFMKDERPKIHARGFRWRTERYGDRRDDFFDELRVLMIGGNVTAHLLFSSQMRPVQLYVSVFGTKCQGIASLDARTTKLVEGAILPGPFAKVQWARHDAKQATKEYRRQLFNLLRARLHYFEGMHELFCRFYNAIKGLEPIPVPMSEALRMTKIIDTIFKDCYESDSAIIGLGHEG